MPEAKRADLFVVPSDPGKLCEHYFVSEADGRREFCVRCGRYQHILLKAGWRRADARVARAARPDPGD